VLPELKKAISSTTAQDESQATYLGKRNPEDGLIDWKDNAEDIDRLIRAASNRCRARTYLGNQKMIIWNASVSTITNHLGGRKDCPRMKAASTSKPEMVCSN
jgi:methionyl-tRNA formyltransferase